ncbi:hypothetical protein Z043_123173 [Scleropages formosus]|uniref:Popeye domain-containing protein 2-like n=1 Tax=Scleropages formosus TaxID=113540 RepID=A0A0P7TDT3_SCLFO|nr:hypothetical protein Z043_123173 [Scleropages formosus]
MEGQFLHYIFPYQFMDSPEWESLGPSEEGKFQVPRYRSVTVGVSNRPADCCSSHKLPATQVTLTAETDCRYISWRRRKLRLLLCRDRYISCLFSVMLGSDIADKLYALNDKLFARSNVRLDIRLPSLYHVLAPPSSADRGSAHQALAPPASAPEPGTAEGNPEPPGQPPRSAASGEDSTSLVLEDFADMTGSFMEYGSERDYLK